MRTAFQAGGMRRSPRLAAAGLALLAMAAQPAPAPAPTRAVGDLVLLTSETVIPGDLYAVGNQVRMEGEVRGTWWPPSPATCW